MCGGTISEWYKLAESSPSWESYRSLPSLALKLFSSALEAWFSSPFQTYWCRSWGVGGTSPVGCPLRHIKGSSIVARLKMLHATTHFPITRLASDITALLQEQFPMSNELELKNPRAGIPARISREVSALAENDAIKNKAQASDQPWGHQNRAEGWSLSYFLTQAPWASIQQLLGQ